MARVTIEDCLGKDVENRFVLVHLCADRVRRLIEGAERLVTCDNKDIVTALREIAASAVTPHKTAKAEDDESCLKIDIPGF